MARVHKSVLVPYSAPQMYALVEGTDAYPAFLPWCGGTRTLDQNDDRVRIRVDINFHGVRSYFTTDNENRPPERISMRLQDGPFRKLDGIWDFRALSDSACKVEFALDYEFTTPAMETVIGPVFNHIADSFIDAFVKRAEAVYRP